jgi:ABC-type sugar transport system ATPase subunit
VLSLARVTKRFGARAILNEISLDVAAGGYIAILGESGVGKCTLLNVIAGLEPVDSGSIVFEGSAGPRQQRPPTDPCASAAAYRAGRPS